MWLKELKYLNFAKYQLKCDRMNYNYISVSSVATNLFQIVLFYKIFGDSVISCLPVYILLIVLIWYTCCQWKKIMATQFSIWSDMWIDYILN